MSTQPLPPPQQPQPSPMFLFNKYTFYYLTHGKAISEFSSEMNIFLRHFCIKKLYELSIAHPETSKEVNNFFTVIQLQSKVKDIATNFNVNKYISFEEYIGFMEKLFEKAEDMFKHNIMTYEFEHYLEIVCAYRLIVDVCELVVEWQEIDEKILQLQNFCKFRVVQIVRMKENEVYRVKSSEELEYMKLEEEVKREKELEKERQKKIMEDELLELEIRHSQSLEMRKSQQQQMKQNIQPATIQNVNANMNANFKKVNTLSQTTINRNIQTNINNTNINPFGQNVNINNHNKGITPVNVQKQTPSKYESLNNKYKQMIENNEQKAKLRSEERIRKIEEHQRQLQQQREEQRKAKEEQKRKQNEIKQQFHNPFQDGQSSLMKSQVLRKTKTSMESAFFNFPKQQQQQQQQPNIQNKLINNIKPNNNNNFNPLSTSVYSTSSIKLQNVNNSNNNKQNINTQFVNINQMNSVMNPFGSIVNKNNEPLEVKQKNILIFITISFGKFRFGCLESKFRKHRCKY